MESFKTTPKILLSVASLSGKHVDDLIAYVFYGRIPPLVADGMVLDVDVAEKAVAWLKEHNVDQEPKPPARDTAKAIGQCRRCGETDSRRKNGRCMGAPGSTHDWPECPSEYERCAKAMAVGAAQGTCKNSGMDCGAHEFRGVFADTNPAYPRKTPIGGIGPRVRGSK